MKRTDLAKNLGMKIRGRMLGAQAPGRFGQAATEVPDRREQRKLDQAAGLLPFAVKLHHDLIEQLRAQAEREGGNLNEVVARLLKTGLAAQGAAAPRAEVKPAKVAKPAVAKKAAAKAPAAKTPALKKAAAKKTAVKAPAPAVKKVALKKAAAKKAAAKK